MNFRSYDMKNGEAFHWNSQDAVPGGGGGKTVPAAGSGVLDSLGAEIFCGDIVAREDRFYLVSLRKGAIWLESLGEGEGTWLHSVVEADGKNGKSSLTVTGNSRMNSGWVVERIMDKISRRGVSVDDGRGGRGGGCR